MSRSVDPIQAGLDYQARFFWLQAATALLHRDGTVARIGFDVPDIPGFDDVVIEHAQPQRGEFGDLFSFDYFQVKFHVDQTGALTAETLTNPAEIGATAISLLGRMQKLRDQLGERVAHARFHFVSTYPVARDDPLAKLVDNSQGGAIRMSLLQRGGARSAMGKLRTRWREHLELASDQELFELLRPLRIWSAAPDLRRVQDELDRLLPAVGLRATRGEGAVAPYDDLIWKLHQEGTYYFSADSLMRECEQAGLATEISPPSPAPHTVGVRSFKRPGVELANQSDDLLCLLDAFDGRFLLPDESWGSVHARMDEFFRRIVAAHRVFRLHLDAHASLAFVAGYLLDAKQGLDISLVQSSRGGVQVWSTATGGKAAGADLSIQEISAGEGDDVALALGITHDVTPDVEQFLTESSPGIGRIIAAQPREGTGQSAVRDSNHAIAIADELARRLKARSIRERAARLHIFAAAPNALMFMLGQLAKGGGHITLYEFDFEGLEGGGYKPSLTVPVE